MHSPGPQLAAGALVVPFLLVAGSAPAQAHTPATHCFGLAATIVGTSGRDTLVGTPGDDVIVGRAGPDQIDGRGGNDVICGNRGIDWLTGGDGDDIVWGQHGIDGLRGGEGNDHLNGGDGGKDYFFADPGDDRWSSASLVHELSFEGAPEGIAVDLSAGTVTGWGTDTVQLPENSTINVQGSDRADTLLGSSGPDTIYGRGGPDTIAGRAGSDRLFADLDTRVVPTGDGPAASVEGGSGDDQLVSGPAGVASGGSGDDRITVFYSGDTPLAPDLSLHGGDGQDAFWLFDASPVGQGLLVDGVYQQVDFDMVAGTFDADTLRVTSDGFEGLLFETVDGHTVSTDFDVTGTDGPNGIYVASLDIYGTSTVVLRGKDGDDRLQSGGGDDLLYGGSGWDLADAQNGMDTCFSIEDGLTGNGTDCEVRLP